MPDEALEKKIKSLHPDYARAMMDWQPVIDLEGGDALLRSTDKRITYLPKLHMEGTNSYQKRADTSYIYDIFNEGVDSISRKPTEDDILLETPYSELLEMAENIDGAGATLTEFFEISLQQLLRYGPQHTLTLLPTVAEGEGEPTGEPLPIAEIRRQMLWPYLQQIPPPRLTNWTLDRRKQPTEYFVRHDPAEDAEEKEFIVTVYGIDGFTVYEVKGDEVTELSSAAYSVNLKEKLEKPPIVTEFSKRIGFLTGRSPLQSVALTNLRHFRASSELDAYESSAMGRTQVYKGVSRESIRRQTATDDEFSDTATRVRVINAGQQPRDVFVIESAEGEVTWISPTVESAESMRTSIQMLEERMRRDLGKLQIDRPDTATGEMIAQAEVNQDLMRYANAVRENIRRSFYNALLLMGIDANMDSIGLEFSEAFLSLFERKEEEVSPNGD